MRLKLSDFTNRAFDPEFAQYESPFPPDEFMLSTVADPALPQAGFAGMAQAELELALANRSLRGVLRQQQFLIYDIATQIGVLGPAVSAVQGALAPIMATIQTVSAKGVEDAIKINSSVRAAGLAMSAVPTIYTQIAGAIISMGTFIADLIIKGKKHQWPEQLVPMQAYSNETDEYQFNNNVRTQTRERYDWTGLFKPRYTGTLCGQLRQDSWGRHGIGWALGNGQIPKPREGGFSGTGAQFNPTGGMGFLPGGERITSILQATFMEPQPDDKIPLYDPRCGGCTWSGGAKVAVIDVGSYYPVTNQGVTSLWAFCLQKDAALYTVDSTALLSEWADYYEAMWDGLKFAWENKALQDAWGCGAWRCMLVEMFGRLTGSGNPEEGVLAGGWTPWIDKDKLDSSDRNAWLEHNQFTKIIQPALQNLRARQTWYLDNTTMAAYLPIEGGVNANALTQTRIMGAMKAPLIHSKMREARQRILNTDAKYEVRTRDVLDPVYLAELEAVGGGTQAAIVLRDGAPRVRRPSGGDGLPALRLRRRPHGRRWVKITLGLLALAAVSYGGYRAYRAGWFGRARAASRRALRRARRSGRRGNPSGARGSEPRGEVDPAACALARWAWDRPLDACGPDAPEPAEAARRLAQKRWSKPGQPKRVRAGDLR